MPVTHPIRWSLCLLILLALLSAPMNADSPVRKVTVVGTAIIKVVPDEMHWTVDININDSTLAKAKDRHDSSLVDALKYIKNLGGEVKDLQTGGIRIQKNYYADPSSAAGQKPFTCSTQITFTLTDFDKYGPICDALAKLDGIQIQDVDYASSKEDGLRREALKQALLNAHDKADDLAVTANCYIDRPLEIQEGVTEGPRPVMMMATMSRSGAGGTPAAVAGQIEISGTVTVTYDLFYK